MYPRGPSRRMRPSPNARRTCLGSLARLSSPTISMRIGRRRLPERSSERGASRAVDTAAAIVLRDECEVASSLGLMENALSRRERLDHRVYSKWLDAAIAQAQ